MDDAQPINTKLASKGLLTTANAYAERGWKVFPVHTPSKREDGSTVCSCGAEHCGQAGKHPRITGWVARASTTVATIEQWWKRWPMANVAVVMGADSHIVDIETDPRNGGEDSWLALVEKLGAPPVTTSFRSGGGGVHRLFKTPEGRTLRKRKGWVQGVDVLAGDNSYAVMPPSRHHSGGRYEWLDTREPVELPEAWLEALESRGSEKAPADRATIDDAERLASAGSDKPGDQYSLNGDHAELLTRNGWQLDHVVDVNERWTRPGKGTGTSGTWHTTRRIFYPFSSSIEGLEADRGYSLFSLRGALEFGGDYGACASAVRGEGFGIAPTAPDGSALTGDKADQQRLRDLDKAHLGRFSAAFDAAVDMDEVNEVVAKIRATELTDATRDALVRLFRDTARAQGHKYTLADCRSALCDPELEQRRAVERAKTEGWLDGWAYTQEGSRGEWVNTDKGTSLSVSVFDQTFAPRLLSPLMRAEGKVRPPWPATDWAINLNLAPIVAAARYCPGREPLYLDRRDGQQYANIWRGIDPAAIIDPMLASIEETEAVAMWQAHLRWMLGDGPAQLLEQFLAWVYRYPTKRPHWCYTIIGPEGIGKSAILALMGAVLGERNVGTVSKLDLQSNFNGWAEGAQLRGIEELMIAYQKRETQTALMDAIANDTVRIMKKGVDSYQTDNVTAYLAFTNSRNPLILTANDRRYYVTETTHLNKAFLKDLGGVKAASAYFKRLFGSASEAMAPVLRGWLGDVDLTGFDAMRAPDSATKTELVEVSKSELEARILALVDSTDAETELVTPGVVNSRVLQALLPNDAPQAIARELREMGYARTESISVDGSTRDRWWIGSIELRGLKGSPLERIRAYLNRRKSSADGRGDVGVARGDE